jgi:hypothetical protein
VTGNIRQRLGPNAAVFANRRQPSPMLRPLTIGRFTPTFSCSSAGETDIHWSADEHFGVRPAWSASGLRRDNADLHPAPTVGAIAGQQSPSIR